MSEVVVTNGSPGLMLSSQYTQMPHKSRVLTLQLNNLWGLQIA